MFKWLTIMLVVLSVFFVLLLGLGYILKENREETTAFVDSIEQQRIEKIKNAIKMVHMQAATEKVRRRHQVSSGADSRKVSQADESLNEVKQQIIISNLICQSDQQCVLIDIASRGNSCLVAINKIGALMLAKINDNANSPSFSCTSHLNSSQAVCINNYCSIK